MAVVVEVEVVTLVVVIVHSLPLQVVVVVDLAEEVAEVVVEVVKVTVQGLPHQALLQLPLHHVVPVHRGHLALVRAQAQAQVHAPAQAQAQGLALLHPVPIKDHHRLHPLVQHLVVIPTPLLHRQVVVVVVPVQVVAQLVGQVVVVRSPQLLIPQHLLLLVQVDKGQV